MPVCVCLRWQTKTTLNLKLIKCLPINFLYVFNCLDRLETTLLHNHWRKYNSRIDISPNSFT